MVARKPSLRMSRIYCKHRIVPNLVIFQQGVMKLKSTTDGISWHPRKGKYSLNFQESLKIITYIKWQFSKYPRISRYDFQNKPIEMDVMSVYFKEVIKKVFK